MVLAEKMNLFPMNGTALSPVNSPNSPSNKINVHYECHDQFCFSTQGKDSEITFTLWNTETGEQIYCSEPEYKDVKITCSNIWWSSIPKMVKFSLFVQILQSLT